MDGHMDGWMDIQNISPFYRTLSPVGAAAQKTGLCENLEDVQSNFNHLKTGSGNRLFFGGTFGYFLGSGGVHWAHRWVTHPKRLRMGWAVAENLVCVRIWRMYNWILIT